MPTKLAQIVAYIDPALKKALQKEIQRSGNRISISSYIEGLVRRHLEAKGAV